MLTYINKCCRDPVTWSWTAGNFLQIWLTKNNKHKNPWIWFVKIFFLSFVSRHTRSLDVQTSHIFDASKEDCGSCPVLSCMCLRWANPILLVDGVCWCISVFILCIIDSLNLIQNALIFTHSISHSVWIFESCTWFYPGHTSDQITWLGRSASAQITDFVEIQFHSDAKRTYVTCVKMFWLIH